MPRSPIVVVSLVMLSLALTSLPSHAGARPGLHWGPPQQVGAGHARAWVAVDVDGEPSSMGVSLDEKALAATRRDGSLEPVLPLPVSSGVRAPGHGPDARLAFRVRWDARTQSHIVALEGLPPSLVLRAAR